MNAQEIYQAAKVLQSNYGQKFTDDKLELWLAILRPVPADRLPQAIHAHITDPERGVYFPTIADIMRHLIRSDTQIKLEAGVEFDIDPCIDGTDSWTAGREDAYSRDRRRREYIATQLAEWQTQTPYENKLAHSGVISWEQAKALTSDHRERLSHG